MLVYRIAKTKHITDLNGTGAKLFGGRWNEKGTPLVYTSSSISLAILESLVHFPLHLAPGDMSLSFINIPDALIENSIELNSLGKIFNCSRMVSRRFPSRPVSGSSSKSNRGSESSARPSATR